MLFHVKLIPLKQRTTDNKTMNIESLKQKAKDTAKSSYSPYSKFAVAAVFETEDERVFSGVNVENASYGLTICAERNAIFSAVTQGADSIKTLVIYTPTQTPTPPCGACRQVIAEFSSTAKIISICDSGEELESNIQQLLPSSFIFK